MGLRVIQVDAFTDTPFAGNPAAVCFLEEARDDAWMQAVAREMNLSETAFVRALSARPGEFDLRWFTPSVEVDLCGHATLASAHALWESGRLAADVPVRFHTRSGVLTVQQREGWVEMDFPSLPESPVTPPAGLAEALGAAPVYVGLSKFDYLAELESEAALRALKPDFAGLRKLAGRGVIVTSASGRPEHDFVSRFFAPNAGVDEDPVTGSAHCVLAPNWARKLGRPALTGYQASARGGLVNVRVEGDRVRLGGKAVTVLAGELV